MKRQEAPLGLATAGDNDALAPSTGKPLAIDKRLLSLFLRAAGSPAVAIELWDGQEVKVTADKPCARIRIADRGALYRLMLHPDLEFGELYTVGRARVEGDLLALAEAVTRATANRKGLAWSRFVSGLYVLRSNTLSRARDNIYHHYDIGNEFYKLWLDDQMVYTCAYFPSADAGLEEAQIAKMDHVSRKLRLQPGEDVVEAGCGWGALALHMARHYGVKVKAYNISKEQLAYARERARREGLADRVEYLEGDYREIQGKFDAFVSVGMLEHVGLKQYRALGAVMDRVLKPQGRGLIHSIGRNRPAPMNAWIEKRIFPGAYPPALSEMTDLFEPWRFSILDIENLRLHYAATLRHWLARFETHVESVGKMFDAPFVRAWRLYLTGSIAAFTQGELQLFQVVFNRYHDNHIPLTREYLYGR